MRLLGASSPGTALIERDGVLGSIVPTAPLRSVVNSVVYRDAGALEAALDDLAAAYAGADVAAWTVWVPELDREAARLLEAAGHHLDAAPEAMVLDLAELAEPQPGDLDWDDRAEPSVVGRLNDAAYGYDAGEFERAFESPPAEVPLRLFQARVVGEPVCVVGTIEQERDCGVYLVATAAEHRGKALARRLLHVALAEARERGCATSTLQATRLGYPIYERLGYETAFRFEMWERRQPLR